MFMPQGSKAAFDKRTHRRVFQRTTRLTYVYYAAGLLENRDPEEVTEEVLKHLEDAQAVIRRAWGATEWTRIASSPIAELDQVTQNGLRNALGEELFNQVVQQPLTSLTDEEKNIALQELGRRTLTEIYRQLLLSVITELWVDYLTQMEALRVSIGLEAYAQRDPLVQYKNRAFGLFQDLLNNMRVGVVTRMFTYRPRDMNAVQTSSSRSETPQSEAALPENSNDGPAEVEEDAEDEVEEAGVTQARDDPAGKNKRRRRRKR